MCEPAPNCYTSVCPPFPDTIFRYPSCLAPCTTTSNPLCAPFTPPSLHGTLWLIPARIMSTIILSLMLELMLLFLPPPFFLLQGMPLEVTSTRGVRDPVNRGNEKQVSGLVRCMCSMRASACAPCRPVRVLHTGAEFSMQVYEHGLLCTHAVHVLC